MTPKTGDVVFIARAEHDHAVDAGKRRSNASGDRGSRGAGENSYFHICGCLAEAALQHQLGLTVNIEVSNGPVLGPDACFDGVAYDAKWKNPYVWTSTIKPHIVYVCYRQDKKDPLKFTVLNVATGQQILDRDEWPPEYEVNWRGNTRKSNLWFGTHSGEKRKKSA